MKKIEGVDLEAAFAEAEEHALRDRTNRVVGAIRNQINARESAILAMRRAEAELHTAKAKLAKADETIAKLRKGDWSVLPEPKDPPGT